MKDFIGAFVNLFKKHWLTGLIWLGVIVVAALLFNTDYDDDSRVVIPITGHDIAIHAPQYEAYVTGVIDGALVTDSTSGFICDTTVSPSDYEVTYAVMVEIGKQQELQNQPGAFAVLNAYHNRYCRK